MANNKKALILGATGLVGSKLVQILIEDEVFSTIKLFSRRSSGFSNQKIEEQIVDFENIDSFKELIKGDVVFSCLGTTLKQAGSKDAQYKVDFTYQYEFANSASNNGVTDYILVSSASASSKSRIFYSRMKGELEDAVEKLAFKRISIIRPGILVGEREKSRLGESIGIMLTNIITRIIPPLKKYRGIKGEEVAQALVNSFKNQSSNKVEVFELEEVFELADT